MPHKEKWGTGITAYEVTLYDVQKEGVPRNWGDGWNWAIKEGGGIFGAKSLSALRTCEDILAKAEPSPSGFAEYGPEDFAKQIVKFIEAAKDAIAGGNADQAANMAFLAGETWARATMKWAWEPATLYGQARLDNLSDARAVKNRHHENKFKRWCSAANEYWKQNPGASKNDAAKEVKEKLQLNEKIDTIARRLQKNADAF